MQARDLMTANPVCCTPADTAQAAARRMIEHDCGCIPVVDDLERRHLVGVVTDRDLAARALAQGKGPETPVQELMSEHPSCCIPETEIEEVERIMMDRQVRRVPVVDEHGRCIGIIAQADLARDRLATSNRDVGRVVERISQPTGQARADAITGVSPDLMH